MKLQRGQKLCKNCNKINGARSHQCKHCNGVFHSATGKKPSKKKQIEVEDWKELNKGDTIKVIGRSGNYYVNDAGERMYMSDAGIYTVVSKDSNGLIVHTTEGGYGYIYMGEEIQSTLMDNMFRSPHKLIRVKTPLNV
jgi:hypothetical protein